MAEVEIHVDTKERTLTIKDSDGSFKFKLIEGDPAQLAEMAGVTLTEIPYMDQGPDDEYAVFIDGKHCPQR